MGNQPDWKVEKQPAWLVAAIKKTIAELPGGYAEAAEWLDVTENSLFNRLRADGDQVSRLGGQWFSSALVVHTISRMLLRKPLVEFSYRLPMLKMSITGISTKD